MDGFCGFNNLDKLGVRIEKIKNTLLVGFFLNRTKSRPSIYMPATEAFLRTIRHF